MRGIALGTLAWICIVGSACVGDSPGGDQPGVDASSSSGDVSSGGGSSSGGASSSGGPDGDGGSSSSGGNVCPEGFGNCDDSADGSCETNLRNDVDHCGRCARRCGGTATCNAGSCSIETVVDQLAQPFGLEVSGARAAWIERPALRGCLIEGCSTPTVLHDLETVVGLRPFVSSLQLAIVQNDLYFSRCTETGSVPMDCGVARCELTGCKAFGPSFLGAHTDRRASVLAAGPGAIFSYSNVLGNGLQRTDLASGTVTNFSVKAVEYFQDFYTDTQDFVYVDDDAGMVQPTGGLYRCPSAGCVGSTQRQRLLPPPLKHLAVSNRVAFTSEGSPASSRILSCSLDDCENTIAVLAIAQPYVTAIAADATDVYWINAGTATPLTNTAAVGTLMRCSLPACAGGPVTVAQGLVNPVSVRVDASYVYWMTYGRDTSPTGALMRQRR